MRKIVASIISFILLLSIFAIDNVEASKNFKDVSNKHRFYEDISFLTEKGAISGFEDGTFKPSDYVTRAQSAVIISNILNLPYDPSKQIDYKDVLNTKWYYSGIQTLAQHKVLSGFKDGTARPDLLLTRAEASKLISIAFNLKAKNESAAKFTDVGKGDWAYTYINNLVQNRITNGKNATKFDPETKITRGEFSAFIKRAYDVQLEHKTISTVSDDSITIDNKTYKISTTLNKFLNVDNANVLKGAKIRFKEENKTIMSIQSLTITAKGTANQMLTFDGQSGILDGNLSINGDNVLLKNITINGDLTISEEVKTSFVADHVTVKGKTVLANDSTVKIAATTDPIVTRVKIVFKDSSVAIFEIVKRDVSLYAEGTTSFSSISISSNVNIFADPDIIIPKVELKDGATRVELNVTIQDIFIESNENIEIGGRGNVENVIINTDKKVDLQITGQISKLTATDINSNIVLGTNVHVKDIVIPEGKQVSEIISNYNAIKEQIESIEGVTNPDYPTSTGGGYSPVEYFDAGLLKGLDFGYVKLNIKNQKADTKVKIQVVDSKVIKLASVGEIVPISANEYINGDDFILWNNHVVYVYQVDSTGKILDAIEIDIPWIWNPVSFKYDFENRTILAQIREKVGFTTVSPQDFFEALYFYSGNQIYNVNDLSFVSGQWEGNELPSFTLSMPVGMSKDTSYFNYYYFKTPTKNNYAGHGMYGKSDALYELTNITLLKNLANNDEDSWSFALILNSFTQESSENRYVNMNYHTSYREAIKSKANSLSTRQDFIDLVKEINAEKQVLVN